VTDAIVAERSALVRRGLWLNYLTIGYNVVEAIVSVAAGLVSGSVALVSFGVDSGIEVISSLAAHWRLRADTDPDRRERVERLTHRIIGTSFLALAAYVIVESATTLWEHEAPDASPVGLVILVLSVVVMPALARASRRVARALGSRALEADAAPTCRSSRLPGWASTPLGAGGGPIRSLPWQWCRSLPRRGWKVGGVRMCAGAKQFETHPR
jgi:divalent metal cation (Fe/Co/Zn/Cd) transporter